MAADRWIEVSTSEFPHEVEGLEIVKALLPDEPGYRAWSNFEFRDSNGRWSEVDLLLLTPSGLHLVELKWYSGSISGNDSTWLRSHGRSEDSPLKLARRKAQRLATKLKDEWRDWVRSQGVRNAPSARNAIPYVQESVFLHHPSVQVRLPEPSRADLYGLDHQEHASGLPGISHLINREPDPRRRGEASEAVLVELMKRIGLVRAPRMAGSWVLEGEAIADGDDWQEWSAFHTIRKDPARIRFIVTKAGTSEDEVRRLNKIALHEARTVERLQHENILRPKDIVDGDLGIGLVYDYNPDWRRLDLWMADHPDGVPFEQQQSILRQVGDALTYAHNNKIVHRGIDPHAILINDRSGEPKVLVAEWQTVGSLSDPESQSPTATGVTRLLTPTSVNLPGFAAPEGALMRRVDRIRVDVFGIGALAFYLLTGQAPAPSDRALIERLRTQGGLDVSAELPQVAPRVRDAILGATRPAVSERTADVATFVAELITRAEPAEEQVDPTEASAGDQLDGRFTVVRRLGSGSTAVGLLVEDAQADGRQRVLKVALDHSAQARLDEEAEVLAKLDSPRIAKLIEGPIDVAGRRALLLTNAGTETLAHRLRGGTRIVLDLLERWGTNLLDALVALDRAGVTHRDIKPANLGIAENPGNRAKELMLFDFSLSRSPAAAVTAGTPPYLDPFLTGKRNRFDSAAERYAAAVVLFEMATGHTPIFGDGASDPAAINDEASIFPSDFDPAVGQRLATFFTKALARDSSRRHQTAQEMRSAWVDCFPSAETEVSPQADELADAATVDTPLERSGLSARARSALEPYRVTTVGDLLSLDAAVVTRLGGAKLATRQEITARLKQWRTRLGSKPALPDRATSDASSPFVLADLFLAAVRSKRANQRSSLVAELLGRLGDSHAFATANELGRALGVTPARISQLMPELQETWGASEATRDALDFLLQVTDAALADLGGVATTDKLAEVVADELIADPGSDERDLRLVEGLVRLAVERRKSLALLDDEVDAYSLRRRPQYLLIARDPALLDVAEQLGKEADKLVSDTNIGDATSELIPVLRATRSLQRVAADGPAELRHSLRLVSLAAATSANAGASSVGELHHRRLDPARAVALTVAGFPSRETLSPDELRERVAARFPSLPPLPKRPKLDELVSGTALHFDDELRRYVSNARAALGTDLESRPATHIVTEAAPVSSLGVPGQRLTDSVRHRSFLALGVHASHLTKLSEVLHDLHGVTEVNLSATLINALRDQAQAKNVPWPAVLEADAAPAGSRAALGLRTLIEASLGSVTAAIEEAFGEGAPVYLTDASFLARHGGVNLLSNWIDLTTPRPHALWLEVPQVHANQGPLLELKPLPLSAASQYLLVSPAWIDHHRNKELVS